MKRKKASRSRLTRYEQLIKGEATIAMKSLIAVILVIASTAVIAQEATTSRNTNLRSSPSTSSPIIQTLPAGTSVTVVGPSQKRFTHIKTSAGKDGWIFTPNLARVNGSAGAHVSKKPPRNFALLLSNSANRLDDRAHTIASKAASVETHECENVTNWETCHSSYPEGCTNTATPNTYDAYLSYMKNLLPTPSSAESESSGFLTSIADFQAFDKQSIAMGLGKQKQVPFADKLADIGQGNIYTAVGYVYYAIVGGIETCNCKLTNPNDRDYHIGLGFDSNIADQISTGEITVKGSKIDTTLQRSSVIVEMTPHYRGQFHNGWTLPRVQELEGRQVKIIGQLIVDNEHNIAAQNCAFDDPGPACWRASAWELHPVAEAYVCTSAAPCVKDSTEGWVKLDDLVEH
jgi:hypothetical protein